MAKLLIFFITIILLTFFSQAKSYSPRSLQYPKLYSHLYKSYGEKKIAGFHYALLSGDKKKLPRKIKNQFKSLFLLHFLTPSGIHLAILMSFLSFFHTKLKYLTTILFFFEGFLAAKRVLLLRIFGRIKIKKLYLFYIVFILDFIFGTYSQNPLSFIFSFLFIGLIHTNSNLKSLFFSFLGAQLLICFFMNQSFSLIGYIIGFILTPLLSFIFPLFLTGAHNVTAFFIEWILYFINIFSEISKISTFNIGAPIVFCILIICMPIKLNVKRLFVVILLMVNSQPTINLKSYRQLSRETDNYRPKYVLIKKTRSGYKTENKNGGICYHRLRNFGFSIDCRN